MAETCTAHLPGHFFSSITLCVSPPRHRSRPYGKFAGVIGLHVYWGGRSLRKGNQLLMGFLPGTGGSMELQGDHAFPTLHFTP